MGSAPGPSSGRKAARKTLGGQFPQPSQIHPSWDTTTEVKDPDATATLTNSNLIFEVPLGVQQYAARCITEGRVITAFDVPSPPAGHRQMYQWTRAFRQSSPDVVSPALPWVSGIGISAVDSLHYICQLSIAHPVPITEDISSDED
jgi:hypothetical protein